MSLGTVWSAVVAIGLGVMFAPGASADPHFEKLVTDKGCVAYLYLDGTVPSGIKFQFSAPCSAGKPISGKGTFSVADASTFTGKWVNGVMNGQIIHAQSYTDENSKTSMPETTESYVMGCPTMMAGKPFNAPGCKAMSANLLGANVAPATVATPATAVVAATPTVGASALTAAQTKICDDTIRDWQTKAPTWPGSPVEISEKLGRLQKGLFTGQCAAHPQAAAFVTGADKMIADTQKPKVP